ncbi:MAG: hypothetical protein V8Q57_04130 [Blautia sp.]
MERIALQKLIDWNNSKRKKPLIIWGQTGWQNLSGRRTLQKNITKTATSISTAKKKMKFVIFVLRLPMPRKSSNIFRCVKENR